MIVFTADSSNCGGLEQFWDKSVEEEERVFQVDRYRLTFGHCTGSGERRGKRMFRFLAMFVLKCA